MPLYQFLQSQLTGIPAQVRFGSWLWSRSRLFIAVRPRDDSTSRAIPSRMESSQGTGLNIVIEMELVGMRAQPDGVDLLVPFVIEPSFDHVLGEDIAA